MIAVEPGLVLLVHVNYCVLVARKSLMQQIIPWTKARYALTKIVKLGIVMVIALALRFTNDEI